MTNTTINTTRQRRARRPAAWLAAAAVGLSAVAGATIPTAASAATPQSSNSTWLASKLVDGTYPNPFSGNPDWGLAIDALLAMKASGNSSLAAPIVTALDDDDQAENYFTWAGFLGEDGKAERTSGALAKSLVAALAADRNPLDFGGYNLVTEVQRTVIKPVDVAEGGRFENRGDNEVGRISDYGPYSSGNNEANTFGQALAVIGLAGAGANDQTVVDKLLWQQCSEGYFRIFYSYNADTSALENCDTGKSSPVWNGGGAMQNNSGPDRDSTAMGVSALLAAQRSGVTGLQDDIDRAVTWLKTQQNPGGGWGGGVTTEAPNTNSTGLIVQALTDAGNSGTAAAAGRSYLVSAQVTTARDSANMLSSEIGAIGYTPADYVAARTTGISGLDTWIRASAQASLGLSGVGFGELVGIARPAAPAKRLTVKAGPAVALRGKTLAVSASGLADGEGYVVRIGSTVVRSGEATATGTVSTSVTIPASVPTGARSVTVTGENAKRVGSIGIQVVAAKKFTTKLKKKKTVKPRKKQTVTVSGLVAGEKVTLTYDGKNIKKRTYKGTANSRGVYTKTFTVGSKTGKRTVVATGAYSVRKGTATFKVAK